MANAIKTKIRYSDNGIGTTNLIFYPYP